MFICLCENQMLTTKNADVESHLSSLSLVLSSALSPELEEPRLSLSLLEPLSLPGPWCFPQARRTRVGELSLLVVSGALLSMAARPTTWRGYFLLEISQQNMSKTVCNISSKTFFEVTMLLLFVLFSTNYHIYYISDSDFSRNLPDEGFFLRAIHLSLASSCL